MRERSLSSVPPAALALLVLALVAQVAWHALVPARQVAASALAPAPSLTLLRLSALGEPLALAKLLMLHVQAEDSAQPDGERLVAWLGRVSDLDPKAHYPLFAASHVYAEGGDPQRKRQMLEFVHQRFMMDPNRRWSDQVYIAMAAKHQLRDLPLALRYARALREQTSATQVPGWARQMEIFVLEEMNELDSAKILMGGMLASGQLNDPNERRFLLERLKALSARKAKQ
ncbi:MAG: hypothetical protein V4631_03210 [Pseudomonadota bacterium]